MEDPSTWLVEQRIADARQRASEDRMARAARRAHGSRSLLERILRDR